MKAAALALASGLDPDASTVHFDDTFDQGQSNTGAINLRIEPIK